MSGRVLEVSKATAVGDLPPDAVVVVRHRGRIVICVDEYLDAEAMAGAFGPNDGFGREVRAAMAVAWPDDEATP